MVTSFFISGLLSVLRVFFVVVVVLRLFFMLLFVVSSAFFFPFVWSFPPVLQMNNISVRSFSGLSTGEIRLMTSASSWFFFLVFSADLMHAWYSGVLSEKPISWTNNFGLFFVGDGVLSGGDSMLNWIFFLHPVFVAPIVLIETGFPRAFADVDWRFHANFLVYSAGILVWSFRRRWQGFICCWWLFFVIFLAVRTFLRSGSGRLVFCFFLHLETLLSCWLCHAIRPAARSFSCWLGLSLCWNALLSCGLLVPGETCSYALFENWMLLGVGLF